MTRLTVTEKEHWKSRIERRIDKAIEALSSQDPTLLPSVKEKAEQAAHKSLGIDSCKATIAKLEREIELLEAQKVEIEKTIVLQVLGKKDDRGSTYYSRHDVNKAVAKRQLVHEDELLVQSPLGMQIFSLRLEKEELLDTVWLATSSVQIRELWGRVAELLDDTPTDLQQKALAIDPVVGEK